MFRAHDEVVCIRLPFEEDPDDAKNARHHLTLGKSYRVAKVNTDPVTGQWLLILRDDLKRGSYHASNFQLVLEGELVKEPIAARPRMLPVIEAEEDVS